MRILKKMMVILMIVMSIFTFANLYTKVEAATYEIKEVQLYSKGQIVCYRYHEMDKALEYVVYEKDGKEYPAYGLNPTLQGATTYNRVNVTVKKAIEDVEVWRVIINGYPFKTPEELGCHNATEAYIATKLAVDNTLYHYEWNELEPLNEQGKNAIEAAEKIAKVAQASKETKMVGKVTVSCLSDEWKVDPLEEGYISKEYEVKTNVESTEYTVLASTPDIRGKAAKVTNLEGKEQKTFKAKEHFKVLIPISEIECKFDVKRSVSVRATANLKTNPIVRGQTPQGHFQDYAMVAGEWEFEQGTLSGTYPSNKTSIKIVKQDAESKKMLAGGKFQILDKNKNIVYTDVTTDENGVAQISGIMPGKYYIEELEAPSGYTKYEETVEIDVAYNEIYTIDINNYEKPQPEEKQVEEEKKVTLTGKKEVLLPQTGF